MKVKNRANKALSFAAAAVLAVTGGALVPSTINTPLARATGETDPGQQFTTQAETGGLVITGLTAEGETALAADNALTIPADIDGQIVVGIGDGAFRDKGITTLDLPELEFIGTGAFQDNPLNGDATLTVDAHEIREGAFSRTKALNIAINGASAIGVDAFRDGAAESVTINTTELLTIAKLAFANNKLHSLTLPNTVSEIKDEAFAHNNLSEVTIADGLTTLGNNVFAHNNQWVKLVTESDAVKTVKYDSGFGQVVKPAKITVHFEDEDHNTVKPDDTYGEVLTEDKDVFAQGVEGTLELPEIAGYEFKNATFDGNTVTTREITFRPNAETYEITVTYKKVNSKPVLKGVVAKTFTNGEVVDKAKLLEGVTATDYKGRDITASIQVKPETIDSSQQGAHEVTYTVTDVEGNTASQVVNVSVGVDWSKAPVGGGWLVEDFSFNGGLLLGFSAKGKAKLDAGKTELYIPEFSDKGEPVTIIGYEAFYRKGLTAIRGTWANVTSIGDNAFANNQLTQLPDSWANVTSIGNYAFANNQLTQLPDSWANVTSIGNYAFNNNQLTQLPDSWANVTSIGDNAFYMNENGLRTPVDASVNLAFPSDFIYSSGGCKPEISPHIDPYGNLRSREYLNDLYEKRPNAGNWPLYKFSAGSISNPPRKQSCSLYDPERKYIVPSDILTQEKYDAIASKVSNNYGDAPMILVTPDGQLPAGLNVKYPDLVQVNPRTVTLKFVDSDGAEVLPAKTVFMSQGQTFVPPTVAGLVTPESFTNDTSNGEGAHTFVYTRTHAGVSTASIDVKVKENIPNKFSRGHIAEVTFAAGNTSNADPIVNPRIRIAYDPTWQPGLFSEKTVVSNVDGVEVRDVLVHDHYVDFTYVGELRSTAVTIPVSFHVADNNYDSRYRSMPRSVPMQLSAFMWDHDKATGDYVAYDAGSDQDVFTYAQMRDTYNVYCSSNVDQSCNTSSNKVYESPVVEFVETPSGESVVAPGNTLDSKNKVIFSVGEYNSYAYHDRYIGQHSAVVGIPTYKATREDNTVNFIDATSDDARAVFIPEENPGWELLEDGIRVKYVGDTRGLDYRFTSPHLTLHFPGAKKNVYNSINLNKVTVTPFTPKGFEPTTEAPIEPTKLNWSFRFVDPDKTTSGNIDAFRTFYSGNSKTDYTSTIIDENDFRTLPMRWNTIFGNATKNDSTNVKIKDCNFDLDGRAHVVSISAPNGAHVVLKNSAGDELLSQVVSNGTVDVPEDTRDNVACIEVTPKDGVVAAKTHFSIDVRVALKEPNADIIPEGGSSISQWKQANVTSDGFKKNPQAVYKVVKPSHTLTATISPRNSSAIVSGQTINYTPGFTLPFTHGSLHDAELVNFVPLGSHIDSIVLADSVKHIPGVKYNVVDNYNGSGHTAVVVTIPHMSVADLDRRCVDPNNSGSLYRCSVADIKVSFPIGVQEGTVNDAVFVTSDGTVPNTVSTDPRIPGDKQWSQADSNTTIHTVKAIVGYKDVRAIREDGTKTAWMHSVDTYPGQKIEYRLRVVNALPAERVGVEFYDVLPANADLSLNSQLRPVPRGSKYNNEYDLAGTPIAPQGAKIQYYNTDEALPEYHGGNAKFVLEALEWSDTPAANTKAIRVVAADPTVPLRIASEQTMDVVIPMIANKAHIEGVDFYPTEETLAKPAKNSLFYTDNGIGRLLETRQAENIMQPKPINIDLEKTAYSFTKRKMAAYEGATFGYFRANGDKIVSMVSGKDGMVKFGNIVPELGDYVQETDTGSDKYALNTAKLVINAEALKNMDKATNTVHLGTVQNSIKWTPIKPQVGKVEFIKTGLDAKPVANVGFTLHRTFEFDGNTITREYTTKSDENGKVVFTDIPVGGGYILTETHPKGHTQAAPDITGISVKHKKTTYVGETVDGTEHVVVNDKVQIPFIGIGITPDKVNLPDGTPRKFGSFSSIDGRQLAGAVLDVVDVATGAKVSTVTTVEDAAVVVADLEPNHQYRVDYVTAPDRTKAVTTLEHRIVAVDTKGNLIGDDGRAFKAQDAVYMPFTYEDQISSVVIKKYDQNDEVVSGAEFTLSRKQDDGSYAPYEVAGQPSTQATAEDGTVRWDNLEYGEYRVVETKAPDGYVLNTKPLDFIALQFEPKTFTFKPENIKNTVNVHKVEFLGQGLTKYQADKLKESLGDPDAEVVKNFSLYDVVKHLEGAEFDLKAEDTDSAAVIEGIDTGATGTATVNTALNSTKDYYLFETQAPDGYTKRTAPVRFNIANYAVREGFDGTVDIYVGNAKTTGSLTISKINKQTGETLTSGSAVFELRSTTDTDFIKEISTNPRNGFAFVQNLPLGEYTLRETQAPDGYLLSDEVHTVTLTKDNAAVTMVIDNTPVKRELELHKKINGIDANNLLTAALLPRNAETMAVSFELENIGNTVLNDVTISDVVNEGGEAGAINKLLANAEVTLSNNENTTANSVNGTAVNGSFTLAPGGKAVVTITAPSPAAGEHHKDTATATGTDLLGQISATDVAHAYRVNVAIWLPATGFSELAVLGIVGLVLLGGLALVVVKRRKEDDELD